MVGSYTVDNLPQTILYKISHGLTSVSEDGSIKPDIAERWKIDENGKTYTFFLRRNIKFTDGTGLTSKYINYRFLDVSVLRPDEYTIIFKLKDKYSPFLVTLSRPIFKKGFIGVGNYKIKDIKLNGDFVVYIDLVSKDNNSKIIRYQFFPTEEALKTAFVLGEVSSISSVYDLAFKNTSFLKFKRLRIDKMLNDQQMVTLFLNTQDKILSEKKLREALSYAIPDTFLDGRRNWSPLPLNSWANQKTGNSNRQDIDHAKKLLSESQGASESSKVTLIIKTLPKYKNTVDTISYSFKKIGINSKIEIVDYIPSTFQLFLGDFSLSKDPDQYMLWHSDQQNNITGYKNLRIDKLLEDGRKTTDIDERKKIYADFQKYLLDDPPAIFLYLPYMYNISRM